jgi:di/tricarboxylate transporter
MSDMAIVFTILGVAVVLFATNKIAVEIVAIGVALSLAATGVLDVDQALAGFGDRTVIFIAALFVVSAALEATGVTTWAGQRLIGLAGDDTRKLLVFTMLLSAGLTSIISVNGAVAALLPMVVVIAVRLGLPTSQLMMPLAFAAHAGSMLALTGTPVNVLISDAADGAGAGRFNFFEFALVGIPLLAIVVVLTLTLGPRLLPMRTPNTLPPDLSTHARTLEIAYLQHGDVVRYDVSTDNSVVGRSAEDVADLLPDEVDLVGVETDEGLTRPDSVEIGDVVIVRGPADAIDEVESATGLLRAAHPFMVDPDLVGKRLGVVEVVVPPRSELIGTEVFPGMVTPSGDLVVLAVQRRGRDLGPQAMMLDAGDVLLVQGDWQALEREIDADNEVLAVDAPQQVRSQAVPLGPRSTTALIITGVMVVLLATGVVPAAIAALLAACAIVGLGVLTPNEAYRGISWTTVFLVAGMIPLSTAMEVSGAAAWAADILVDLADGSNPRVLLFGVFVLSAIIGSVISNTATALIVIPIALSAASDLDIAAQPVLMAVGVSTSAAFLLPITTPANLMVMGPGGYRFNDYWKFGLPILFVYGLMVVFYLPLIWAL